MENNNNGGGCGCLSLTIVIIIIWMACTGRLVALIDKLIDNL